MIQNICKILYSERCPGDLEEETMKLFYDMTFQLGDLFVTLLTFTNYFYVGCPVMPLAVNVHERKFKSRKVSSCLSLQNSKQNTVFEFLPIQSKTSR